MLKGHRSVYTLLTMIYDVKGLISYYSVIYYVCYNPLVINITTTDVVTDINSLPRHSCGKYASYCVHIALGYPKTIYLSLAPKSLQPSTKRKNTNISM